MEIHRGQIVEKVIRREGHSISEISRLLKVNRRSVYNWFNQPHLRPEIIYRLGCIIKHDFSVELPMLFKSGDFSAPTSELPDTQVFQDKRPLDDSEYWKLQYDKLLKSYNLLKQDQVFVAI